MQNISRKIQDIEFELDKMEIDFEGKLSIKFTGQAFVSFRYEVQKQAFLKKYKKRGTCWNWFGCCARIDNKIVLPENTMDYKAYAIRAPEPNDVYWDALCYRTRDVRKFTVLSWFLGILLMVFSFSAVVGMYIVASNFQTELVRTNKKYSYLEKLSPIVQLFRNLIPSLMIVVINLLTNITIEQQAKLNKPRTVTGLASFCATVGYKVKIFNTTFAPIASTFTTLYFFNKAGLVTSIVKVMIMNVFVTNALFIFDFKYYLQLLKKKVIEKCVKKGRDSKIIITQKEANLEWEKQDWNMATRVTSFFSNLGLALFFLPMIPFGTILALIAVIIEYFIDWYILIRRSNNKKSYSQEICKVFTKEYEFCMQMYALGIINCEILCNYMNLDGWHVSWPSIILLGLVLLTYIFNGKWQHNKIYHNVEPRLKKQDMALLQDKYANIDLNNVDYKQMKQMCDDDYDLSNPVNARLGKSKQLQELIDRRESKKIEDEFSKSEPDTELEGTQDHLMKL